MIDREKLAKLCGLLASNFAGKRASAALLASTMIKEAGLTWHDVIAPALPAHDPDAVPDDWETVVEAILASDRAT